MKKIFNRNRIILFLCTAFFLLSGSTFSATHPQSRYVLMIYMNGSDLESDYKLATENISDMLSAPQQDQVTVLLLMGGTRQWHLSASIPSDSIIYATITSKHFQKVRMLPNQSIGQAETLSEFIRYGMREYPADHYGLIFWNHGSGSVIGFGKDEQHPDNTTLSLSEIRTGLENSGMGSDRRFSFIGFDACLMATLETAVSLVPYTDYLVASQELEPGSGWDYCSLLKNLNQFSGTSGKETGISIANSLLARNRENSDRLTLSVTDLRKIPVLNQTVEKFAQRINQKLSDESDSTGNTSFYSHLIKSRQQSRSFGIPSLTYSGPDMVDLLDLARNVGKDNFPGIVDTLIAQAREAVVYQVDSYKGQEEPLAGLSVYFPCQNTELSASLPEYQQCGIGTEYLRLVNTCFKRLLEKDQAPKIEDALQDDSLRLSTEMILNLRKIYAVLQYYDKSQWITYGMDGDGISLDATGRIIQKDASGALMPEWNRKWIHLGDTIASVYQAQSDAASLTYTVPARLNHKRVDLIVRFDASSASILGARQTSDNLIPDKGLIPLKANDEITLLHEIFQEKDSTRYVPGITYRVKKKKDAKAYIKTVHSGRYRYGYCLVDLYGHKYYTPFKEYEVK